MRSVFVLLANCHRPEGGGQWPLRGLALFLNRAVPTLQVASLQAPEAFARSSGPLCGWSPAGTLRAVVEALTSTQDVERELRGAIFSAAATVARLFDWGCRFEIYRDIMDRSRVDAVVGAMVTLFKEDWWLRAQNAAAVGGPLTEDLRRLLKVLRNALGGEVQIVDGMDTLVAGLNLARLVALAKGPLGDALRPALTGSGSGPDAVNLDALLAGISGQIDFELGMLRNKDRELSEAEAAGQRLAAEIDEHLSKALSESGIAGRGDTATMKRDRIEMVAHLVARVRELLA